MPRIKFINRAMDNRKKFYAYIREGVNFLNNSLITELIDVLQQENAVYEDILKISKNKTNIIVEGKVKELESIVKIEQSLVLQMAKLEDKRESLVGRLSQELNIKPEDITISGLVKYLQDADSRKLKWVQDKLGNTLGELKESNELNSKLIKNSLDYINFSVNILSDASSGSNNYGNNGQVGDTKKKNFFDMKL